MNACLIAINLVVLWDVSRGGEPAERRKEEEEEGGRSGDVSRGCTESYCYHVLGGGEKGPSAAYRRHRRDWKTLPELGHLCREALSGTGWPLEIYSEAEQRFVERLLAESAESKPGLRKERPVVVPLNLNVSYLSDWTWLSGDRAPNMTSNPSEHYAYLHVDRNTVELLATSSDLPYHMALCHVQRRHCKELRSSFMVGDYCMYKIKERLTWHRARFECRQRRGELTSVLPGLRSGFPYSRTGGLTTTEQLPHYLTAQREVWVGLRDVAEEWLKKNGTAIYTNWGGDPVVPFRSEHDFVFLELDSLRWSVSIPQVFEMRVVCMTDNLPNVSVDTNPTNAEDCRPKIAILVALVVVTSLVAISVGVFCALEKTRPHRLLRLERLISRRREEVTEALCSIEVEKEMGVEEEDEEEKETAIHGNRTREIMHNGHCQVFGK